MSVAGSHSSRKYAQRSPHARPRSIRSNLSWGSRRSKGIELEEDDEDDYSPQQSMEEDQIATGSLENRPSELSIPVDSIISPASTNNGEDDYFVTSPPKRSGLTGSISTLFRRAASREHGSGKPRGGSGSVGQSQSGEYETDGFTDAHGDETTDAEAAEGPEIPSERHAPDQNELFSSPAPTATTTREETDGEPSPKHRRGRTRTRSGQAARIYSSFTGSGSDSEDDSFETRSRGRSNDMTNDMISPSNTTQGSEYPESDSGDERYHGTGLKRYRGFSTSVASLFLDESLVCTSIGCFGLILSNRTEYLLQVRDHIRGVKQSKKNQTADKRSPSKVFSYLLLLTIVLIFMTFVIWGFGNGNALAEDLYADYSNNDDNAAANNNNGGDDYYYNLKDQQSQDNRNDDYYSNYYKERQDDVVDNNNDDDDNDDGKNNNSYAANDDGGANNDDGGNNYYANNDDGGNDDGNANNDDGGNDDGNAYSYGDDNANYDDGNAGDDYYAADDDGRRLRRQSPNPQESLEIDTTSSYHHRALGIFKLRDCQEHVWDPVAKFAQEQWNREATAQRSLADAADTDDFDPTYDIPERDLATDVRAALFLTFLLFLGVLGRRRRMRTRFQLVRARAQDDVLFQMANSNKKMHLSMKDELEDKAYEVACSHTILGCYPVDPPSDDVDEEELGVNDQGITTSRKKAPKHEDFVSRGFKCLMAACCGFCCKCWFQCLSVCALAQEAREMRLLLPPRYQRIDYITHQPFSEYQKDVNELRLGWMGKKRKKGGLGPHWNALSRLSRYILFTALATFLAILGTLIFNPKAAFSWPDAVLLVATFVQSFLVLYIVHWLFHRSDLSLDAVIKFFAAGFVIAVPSAVFFEGILVNIILMSAWTVYEFAHSLIGDDFATWMASNYRLVWILGELFNAYIVAAVIEELCKYYTFRCVEHPDLIFLTGLDRKSHDEHAADGGLTSYPFGAHNVGEMNQNKSWDSQRTDEEKLKKILHTTNTTEEFYEDENDVRTYRQKAAAVTTGMISVAVGLACAENMMYVFLLGGARGSSTAEHRGDVYEEWIVLLFRSVFPIHALAAALQSTNMIRKFVEGSLDNNHRIGVGRIILPAVILHGTFDAILMGINVYVESAWDAYLEENEGRIGEGEPYNPRTVNFAAWLSICMVTMIGFFWYIRENRSQRERLIILEDKEKSTYKSPTGGASFKRERSRSPQKKTRNSTKQ